MDNTIDLSVGSILDDGATEYRDALREVHRYLEATTSSTEKPTKPGILRRIWNAIVAAFRWIRRKLKKLYRSIKVAAGFRR